MENVRIRSACKEDVPGILWLIQLLAEFENEPHGLKIGEKELLRDGFGEEKYFHVLLAELKHPPPPAKQEGGGGGSERIQLPSQTMRKYEQLIGYAFYFYTYSTWEGRVIHIEDLFVREEYRRIGIGTALMRECAKLVLFPDPANEKGRRTSEVINVTYQLWKDKTKTLKTNVIRSFILGKDLIAVSKDCARLIWQVLDWNTKAIDFYEKHGGQCLKEWLPMRMNKDTLTRFAGGEEENEQQT